MLSALALNRAGHSRQLTSDLPPYLNRQGTESSFNLTSTIPGKLIRNMSQDSAGLSIAHNLVLHARKAGKNRFNRPKKPIEVTSTNIY
jgi:hypothetical protein